jgi:hypothetical protein
MTWVGSRAGLYGGEEKNPVMLDKHPGHAFSIAVFLVFIHHSLFKNE